MTHTFNPWIHFLILLWTRFSLWGKNIKVSISLALKTMRILSVNPGAISSHRLRKEEHIFQTQKTLLKFALLWLVAEPLWDFWGFHYPFFGNPESRVSPCAPGQLRPSRLPVPLPPQRFLTWNLLYHNTCWSPSSHMATLSPSYLLKTKTNEEHYS